MNKWAVVCSVLRLHPVIERSRNADGALSGASATLSNRATVTECNREFSVFSTEICQIESNHSKFILLDLVCFV